MDIYSQRLKSTDLPPIQSLCLSYRVCPGMLLMMALTGINLSTLQDCTSASTHTLAPQHGTKPHYILFSLLTHTMLVLL